MSILLIRHGMTPANESHLYCGSTDLPLSPRGKSQLEALSYPLPSGPFFTSGMRRANETLAILFGPVAYTVDPRFREVDFGIFEMKSYAQLKDDPAYQTWLTGDNEANIPPQGESGAQMTARALDAFHQLPADAVVVTHGGVIAAIMAALFPDEGKNRYQWQPQPGHGYRLEPGKYSQIP